MEDSTGRRVCAFWEAWLWERGSAVEAQQYESSRGGAKKKVPQRVDPAVLCYGVEA